MAVQKSTPSPYRGKRYPPPTTEDRREPAASLAAARTLAAQRFKIHRLHEEQASAIESVLAGRDTVAVLPTGYGKSLIYQVPAALFGSPVVVVSPLIALMRDQEASLKRYGVPTVRLDSTLGARAKRDALTRIQEGGTLVILTTPETLCAAWADRALRAARPVLLCVDEAHCISEWGHDFRPAYLRLHAQRKRLGFRSVLALTATATPRVIDDLTERLALTHSLVLRAPPHRPNLRLRALTTPGNLKLEVAGRMLRRMGRPGIVYCATTRAVDEIYAALRRARIPCERYHGKMSATDRNAAQKRFMRPGKRIVMVATTAFGMGIDKRDIRYVLHFQVPGSPEQYVQEAGRAGRDGHRSDCILLYDEADLAIQEHLQEQGRPQPGQLRRVGKALGHWAKEGRPVSTADLATSAGVPRRVCASLCADLEQAGLISLTEKRAWRTMVSPLALMQSIEDLASRYETKRRQDAARLKAMADYATSDGCRSILLRQWFGEESPPRCGRCDSCQADSDTARSVKRALDAAREGNAGQRRRRKSRPRRRKRRTDRRSARASA